MPIEAIPEPLYREIIDTDDMVRLFPPRLADPHKRLIHSIACPDGSHHQGKLVVSRWQMLPKLPAQLDENANQQTRFSTQSSHYDYQPGNAGGVEWHVNFADGDLFVAYGSHLFAQDEIQVAEHPSLGSLRDMLFERSQSDAHYDPCTRDDDNHPTPILIHGIERRVAISIDPNPAEGRPEGLYGNRLARASADAVRSACRNIDPPTTTNLIAMEAPPGGTGHYTDKQIRDVLNTAATAFAAARIESGPDNCTIHSGNWGAGAYGGNRVLMALLQVLAARLVGVDEFVFHSRDLAPFIQARHLSEQMFSRPGIETVSMAEVIRRIIEMEFRWGVSDGN